MSDQIGLPRFIVLSEEDLGVIPTRATAGSAGYDLSASKDCIIPVGKRILVPTNVSWRDFPMSFVGIIKPRSGMALGHGIDTMAGVIDADYEGEINVLLINHGEVPYKINAGDRIAQLVILPFVSLAGETFVGERAGGYGSTGK